MQARNDSYVLWDCLVNDQIRYPRFFVTASAPCPYLPGKSERKVFTELKGENAPALNEALSRIGFRRSQTVAYRPSCTDCMACVSVRVVANAFEPSKAQKRALRAHSDIEVLECRPWASEEQFDLLRRYLAARHPDGGMAMMDEIDYADMVEHTPITTHITEYREPSSDGVLPGRLIGVCLTDEQDDGLSMVYSFYDPAHKTRKGLGNFIILDHIKRAAAKGLPYVYLGYWVDGSDRMQYKVRYRPLEKLSRLGWVRFSREDQDAIIRRTVTEKPLVGAAAGNAKSHQFV